MLQALLGKLGKLNNRTQNRYLFPDTSGGYL